MDSTTNYGLTCPICKENEIHMEKWTNGEALVVCEHCGYTYERSIKHNDQKQWFTTSANKHIYITDETINSGMIIAQIDENVIRQTAIEKNQTEAEAVERFNKNNPNATIIYTSIFDIAQYQKQQEIVDKTLIKIIKQEFSENATIVKDYVSDHATRQIKITLKNGTPVTITKNDQTKNRYYLEEENTDFIDDCNENALVAKLCSLNRKKTTA